jgi:hypothetical protein
LNVESLSSFFVTRTGLLPSFWCFVKRSQVNDEEGQHSQEEKSGDETGPLEGAKPLEGMPASQV